MRVRLVADVVTDGSYIRAQATQLSWDSCPGMGGRSCPVEPAIPDLLEPGITRCLYTECQLAPQVLLPLACPLAPFPLPVGHGDEGVAKQLQMPSLQQGVTRDPLAPCS